MQPVHALGKSGPIDNCMAQFRTAKGKSPISMICTDLLLTISICRARLFLHTLSAEWGLHGSALAKHLMTAANMRYINRWSTVDYDLPDVYTMFGTLLPVRST